jgi:hypothetical protein
VAPLRREVLEKAEDGRGSAIGEAPGGGFNTTVLPPQRQPSPEGIAAPDHGVGTEALLLRQVLGKAGLEMGRDPATRQHGTGRPGRTSETAGRRRATPLARR